MLTIVAFGTSAELSMLEVNKSNTIHLLVMAPFPDSQNPRPPAFSDGHSLIPAVLLAMDHINMKQDILSNHTLKAVIGSSGCEQVPKTALSFIPNVSGKNITKPLAVIGPTCSESSVYVASLCGKDRLNLVQTVIGTTPELDEHVHRFPNTFGMVSSTRSYANLLANLAECNNWTNVSIIYEPRQYFLQTLQAITNILNHRNINVSYTGSITLSPLNIPLTTASHERQHTRIIVVLASRKPAQSLACMASALDFTFPNYQFIFINRKLDEFLIQTDFRISIEKNGEPNEFDCNEENIRNGLEGSVLLRYSLRNSDESAYTISGRTVREVSDDYSSKIKQMCSREMHENALFSPPGEIEKVRYSDFVENFCLTKNQTEESIFAYPYYDATWAIALSLHNILTTTDHNLSSSESTTLLHNEMHQISFQGVSTYVQFDNESGHLSNSIDIFHIKSDLVTKITNHNGSRLTCYQNLSALFISNTFPVEYEAISIYSIVIGTVLILLSATLTGILHILHTVYRKHHSVKARSPLLNHFIFAGCYTFILSVILDTVALTLLSSAETGSLIVCNITFFLNNLGYDLIFGTLCVKMWRLYNIFVQTFKKQRLLSNPILVLYVMIIILTCIFFHLWMIAYRMQATHMETEVVESEEGYVQMTRITCQFKSIGYIFIPIVYHIVLTIATLTLCILNRNIQFRDFKNSRGILVLSYLLGMTWVIERTLWIVYTNDRKDIIYLLHTVASTCTVFLCHWLLIIPVTLQAMVTHYHLPH